MATNNNKNVGNSPLSGKPKKPLLFILKDKSVTLSKLADDVKEWVQGIVTSVSNAVQELAQSILNVDKRVTELRNENGQLRETIRVQGETIQTLENNLTQAKRELQDAIDNIHVEESLKHVVLTQESYDALEVKDRSTLYIIVDASESQDWHFGDNFPIILSGAWGLGEPFPITLT